jgi:hypothetical protein
MSQMANCKQQVAQRVADGDHTPGWVPLRTLLGSANLARMWGRS